MYERFTERVRKVMQLANREAQRFNHEYIDTEHILLGVVKEGSGIAATVLGNLGVDLRKIRLEVEKQLESSPEMVTMGKLPQTPRAKRVIEYSMEEARNLNHAHVGTEHILLGLLREQEGKAAQVLMNLGLEIEAVQKEVLNVIGHQSDAEHKAAQARETTTKPNLETDTMTDAKVNFEVLFELSCPAAITVEAVKQAIKATLLQSFVEQDPDRAAEILAVLDFEPSTAHQAISSSDPTTQDELGFELPKGADDNFFADLVAWCHDRDSDVPAISSIWQDVASLPLKEKLTIAIASAVRTWPCD